MLKVWAAFLSVWPLGLALAGPMAIVEKGQAKAVIVTPDKPLRAVAYAAEELQKHVEMVSGARLEIAAESAVPAGARIYLGPCKATAAAGLDVSKLPFNAFIIRLTDAGFFLIGDDSEGPVPATEMTTRAGTLFAVYEFLEKQLGVRWLWPGDMGTFAPKRDTIIVASWDQVHRPHQLNTCVRAHMEKYNKEDSKGFSSIEAYGRYKREEEAWLTRHRMSMPQSASASHAPKSYAYWQRFGATGTHLEYFALLNTGKRETMRGNESGSRVTWCVSQPKLWDQVVADWVEYKDPSGNVTRRADTNDFVQAGENDCPGLCMCEACRAWDEPDPRFATHPYWNGTLKRPLTLADRALFWGHDSAEASPSLSGRYAKFWMKVLERAKKVRPDARLATFAYANTYEAPKQTKLHPDVWVRVVAPFGYPFTEKKLSSYEANWQAWAATGATLVHRPNYMLCGHNMPLYFAGALARNLRFVFQHNCRETDFDSLLGAFANQGPTLYTLVRLHVRPEMTGEQVLDEYYAIFGAAKDKVRAYFDHWRDVCGDFKSETLGKEVHETDGAGYETWALYAPQLFTPEAMKRGEELLAAAEAAAKGDAATEQRLRYLRAGFDDAANTLALVTAMKRYQAAPGKPELYKAFVEQMRKTEAHRHANEGLFFCNLGAITRLEALQWDRKLLGVTGMEDLLALEWKFRFDPEQVGEKEGWDRESYDDSAWGMIRTDTFWEKQEVGRAWQAKNGRPYDGLGWYRLKFDMPASRKGKKSYLVFGAVDESCKVWFNGKLVAERVFDAQKNPNSWNEAFCVDITHTARWDAANTVVVMAQDLSGGGGLWKRAWLSSAPVEASAAKPAPPAPPAAKPAPAKPVPSTPAAGLDSAFKSGGKGMSWVFVAKPGSAPGQAALDMNVSRGEGGAMRLEAGPGIKGWFAAKIFGVKPGVAHDVRLWLRGGQGAENIVLAITAGEQRAVVHGLSAEDWKQVTLRGVGAVEGSSYIYLSIRGLEQGSLWVDDVEVTPAAK